MRAGELRELTDEELRRKETEIREELFNLRMQLTARQVSSTARVRSLKRDLARVLTTIRERELNIRRG